MLWRVFNEKITGFDLLLFACAALVLLPSAVSFPGTTILQLACACVALIYVVARRYAPSGFVGLLLLYYLVLITSSFINGSSGLTQGFCLYVVKTMGLFVCFDFAVQNDCKRTLRLFYYLLMAYCMVDVAGVLLYPDGLYQNIRVWNPWSSSEVSQWLFGNKNNHVRYFAPLMILSAWDYKEVSLSKLSVLKPIVCIAASVGTTAVLDSNTSLVVTVLIAVGCVIYMVRGLNAGFFKSVPLLFIVYFAVEFCILLGLSVFLEPIVSGVFGKDLTFSSRATIWENVMRYIAQKPLIGWGYNNEETVSHMLGHQAYVNAHNQFLNTAFQGGAILAALLVIGSVLLIRKIHRCKRGDVKILVAFFFLALFVEMTFEQMLDSSVCWFALFVGYALLCACDVDVKSAHTVVSSKDELR